SIHNHGLSTIYIETEQNPWSDQGRIERYKPPLPLHSKVDNDGKQLEKQSNFDAMLTIPSREKSQKLSNKRREENSAWNKRRRCCCCLCHPLCFVLSAFGIILLAALLSALILGILLMKSSSASTTSTTSIFE
ncbi:unnamed protein product, partial [Rotaria magnacalcarata]